MFPQVSACPRRGGGSMWPYPTLRRAILPSRTIPPLQGHTPQDHIPPGSYPLPQDYTPLLQCRNPPSHLRLASGRYASYWNHCAHFLVSTYVVCERLSVMHKQVPGWTVNFCPNFPESPFLEFQTRKPPPPISENFRLEMTKVYSRIPPPISENFRFEMTKVYSGIPPLPISENAWDRMWRLICNPQGYHSLNRCLQISGHHGQPPNLTGIGIAQKRNRLLIKCGNVMEN